MRFIAGLGVPGRRDGWALVARTCPAPQPLVPRRAVDDSSARAAVFPESMAAEAGRACSYREGSMAG